MLQKIGEHIQGWIAGVVITLVALTFVLWGLEYYISNGNHKNVMATVNGTDISAQQFNLTYNAMKAQYGQGGNLSTAMQQQLQNYALQELILNQALLQTAQKAGFAITRQQAEQAVMQFPEFQVDGKFSPERLQQLLAANNMNLGEFMQNMRSSLVLDQLSTGIQNSAFALPNEIQQTYALLKQQRSFGYFILPLASIAKPAQASPQDIKNYYDQHQSEFLAPEQVKVAYIILTPDQVRETVKIDPAQVKQYYEDNKTQFPNKTFEQAQKEVEQRLQSQQVNQILADKNEEMANLVYTDPTSLEKAAKSLKLKIQTTDWLSKSGEKTGVFSDPKVMDTVFSDEVLKKSNNSQPLILKDGSVLALRVAEHQPSQTQKLDTVSAQIKQKLQKEAAQKQAGLKAYEVQKQLNDGKDPAAVAMGSGTTWTKKDKVTREDKTIPAAILQAAFNLPPKQSGAKPTTTVVLPNGDYAVIQLAGVQNADYNPNDTTAITRLRTGLENPNGTLDYQLFTKSVVDKSKVKINTAETQKMNE